MFPVVLLLVHDCTSEVIALDEWAAPYMVASAPRMVTVKTGNLYESTVHIPFDDVIDSVKL